MRRNLVLYNVAQSVVPTISFLHRALACEVLRASCSLSLSTSLDLCTYLSLEFGPLRLACRFVSPFAGRNVLSKWLLPRTVGCSVTPARNCSGLLVPAFPCLCSALLLSAAVGVFFAFFAALPAYTLTSIPGLCLFIYTCIHVSNNTVLLPLDLDVLRARGRVGALK